MIKSIIDNNQPNNNELIPEKTDKLIYTKKNSIENGQPTILEIDKAIIISDVHLVYEKCNVTAFTDFLTAFIENGTSKDYSLFIIGDLWGYLSLM